MTRRSLLAALLPFVVVVAAGCGSSENAPEPEAKLVRYDSVDKARTDAEILLSKLEPDKKLRDGLLRQFDALLKDPEVAKAVKEKGISATVAATGGSGALVVRVDSASGLACFAGGRQAVAIETSGWSVGATAGGEKTYAVGIVCGLGKEADFVGDYNVKIGGALAQDAIGRMGTGLPHTGSHVAFWVGTGVGFGGGVSAGEVSVSWGDAPPK